MTNQIFWMVSDIDPTSQPFEYIGSLITKDESELDEDDKEIKSKWKEVSRAMNVKATFGTWKELLDALDYFKKILAMKKVARELMHIACLSTIKK